MIVWHYTWGHKWPRIRDSGLIKVSDYALGPRERPVVWFSTREDMEPTAVKRHAIDPLKLERITLTLEQSIECCDGAYRIGVDREELKMFGWLEFIKTSGAAREDITAMRKIALHWRAAPSDWWATYQPVSKHRWRAVERRNADGTWHSIDVKAEST